MALSAGTRLGPYVIESQIGAGAMGEVYKARDPRLNRTVAIKHVTAERAVRFGTEARAIAALNHPNICQIYDLGSDYLVLEYLPGEVLRGPLSPDTAVALAIQMAEALETAHAVGILHRDLKPANVMVVDRGGSPTAKLLDFGIARFADSHQDATRTAAGAVIGTPAYMSPEQAQGHAIDVRSDIFSFGAVLYEILSGTRAFQGEGMIQVLVAVVQGAPKPLDAPPALQQIVMRCLAKDPAARFQSMTEVRQALERVTIESGDLHNSIVVLPFASLSEGKDNEYFGDGLAEEIINALANVGGLKVIARTSAFSFKGRNQDVRNIAQALGVKNVLDGSVRRSGDRLRVTAQLISASDGTPLWSERFDRSVRDVFEMQDEIAQAITTALKGRLIAETAGSRSYTPGVTAYETFLKGRAYLVQFTPDSFNRAKSYFSQAITLDPGYADPHAELALGYFIAGMHGVQPMRDAAPLVRAEAMRALELNPSDPRPRFLLGAVALVYDYDWEAAKAHFDASMHEANVSPYARWIHASLYLRALGRFQESAAEMARAVEIDPLNATWHGILSLHLADAGRYEEAIKAARTGTTLEPGYFLAHHLLGEAYWAAGRIDDAVASFEHAVDVAPRSVLPTSWLAVIYRLRGEAARAEELIAGLRDDQDSMLWGRVAYYLMTGDIDQAAHWFGEMIERRDPFVMIHLRSKTLQPLREHPRWPELAARMRLET
jgi:eukaryotic-like serine/threonine-protein kinase